MYPKAYVDFLIHFHCDRDYFECHEILEEHWKADIRPERKPYWVGLIQIAVSLYHHRRGNFTGALKMIKSSISIIENQKKEVSKLGLHVDNLLKILNQKYDDIKNKLPYKSIDLPINDHELFTTCTSLSQSKGMIWGKHSAITDHELIHKHILRDRSEVIAERERQLQKRKMN
ncbi:DUF309 domain-containing protein [Ferdinandcohnia quinoae]|uniref:DUF309 domain-containing protein n=1 Tax=Fredinandcohnia quinoae TaxID=2918902 RepID=A0AAW5E5Y7_9BACI|nr:DUF309 domain-containing protein [Fredinandcohnia sp. SECRCQ15]MCH1624806.1 DUF309 domain-containing protein [Fredinandcohnia sp. SECRCQ15]